MSEADVAIARTDASRRKKNGSSRRGADWTALSAAQPAVFWLAMFAALAVLIVALREVLLPFVAGMVLAYLLNPLANRFEKLGLNRLTATLAILAFVVVILAALVILTVPVIVRELSKFIDDLPLYVGRLHMLAADPNRPWLSKIAGEGLGETERSIADLTNLASSWSDTILRSIWSGGRALISILSLGIVAPIVALYLLYDWNGMIATIDNWIPPGQRETVRSLAREVDDTIGGFVRGQGTLCLVLATYYAVGLRLIGLEHGILIGIAAGLVGFIAYLGSRPPWNASTAISRMVR